jgi:hypothetical protein
MAEGQNPVEPHGEGAGEATDWKAEARKWEKRSKENAEKAMAYDELQAQSKTDLQKAREQAAAYKKQVDELNAKAEQQRARAKVSEETGVPADLIMGADEDEMRAFAQKVAEWRKPPSAPRSKRPGSFSSAAGSSLDEAKRELARKMFGSE